MRSENWKDDLDNSNCKPIKWDDLISIFQEYPRVRLYPKQRRGLLLDLLGTSTVLTLELYSCTTWCVLMILSSTTLVQKYSCGTVILEIVITIRRLSYSAGNGVSHTCCTMVPLGPRSSSHRNSYVPRAPRSKLTSVCDALRRARCPTQAICTMRAVPATHSV